MTMENKPRGSYRKDFIKRSDPHSWLYYRGVPTDVRPIIGRKYWAASLGPKYGPNGLSEHAAVAAARAKAVEHDKVIAAAQLRLAGLTVAELAAVAIYGDDAGTIRRAADSFQGAATVIGRDLESLTRLPAGTVLAPSRPGNAVAEKFAAFRTVPPIPPELRQQVADAKANAETLGRLARKLKGDDRDSIMGLVNLWELDRKPRNPQTRAALERFVRRFVAVIGDIEPRAVTPEHALRFRDKMEAEGQTPVNIRKMIKKLRSLFNVGVNERACSVNPFYNIRARGLSRLRDQDDSKKPWTRDQLRTIWTRIDEMGQGTRTRRSERIRKDTAVVVKILMFTGARPGEICQLYVDDVLKVDGVWCIRIKADDARHQSVKNRHSARIVPLPSQVRELVLEQVKARKEAGEERLFCFKFNASKRSYLDPCTKAFSDFVRGTLVYTDPRQTLHSFRHSHTDAMKTAGLPDGIRYQIAGRERGKGSEAGYGQGVDAKTLAKWMGRVKPIG
jgi:integrase